MSSGVDTEETPAPANSLDAVQERAIAAIEAERLSGAISTYVRMATGMGKTTLFSKYGKRVIERGGRVLILNNTRDLVEQSANKFRFWSGHDCLVEMSDQRAYRAAVATDTRCVVASVQSMQGARLAEWPEDFFDTIVTDECDYAVSPSFAIIPMHFGKAFHLGVTATDRRMDRKSLRTVYSSRCFAYDIAEAVRDGNLIKPEFHRCATNIDLKNLRIPKNSDIPEEDLAELLSPHLEVLANAVLQEMDEHFQIKQALVFCPTVRCTMDMADALCGVGLSAVGLHGESPNRNGIVDQFRAGEFRLLCCRDLFTRGVDFPFLEGAFSLRPTKSVSLLQQMVGRLTRLSHATGKKRAHFIEPTWTGVDMTKLVNAADAFATDDVDRDALRIARDLLDRRKESDPEVALRKGEDLAKKRWEKAQETLWRAEQQIEERKARTKIFVQRRQISYRRTAHDPIGGGEQGRLNQQPLVQDGNQQQNQPTTAQLNRLLGFGYTRAELSGLSSGGCGRLISSEISAFQKGLASKKQRDWLGRLGVHQQDSRRLTRDQASREIDRLRGPKKQDSLGFQSTDGPVY